MATIQNPADSSKIPYSQLRDHEKVDRVVPSDDHLDIESAMVIVDWVTDATMSDGGTRLIHETDYDGHIRIVGEFIKSISGVEITSKRKTGIGEYTFHVRPTRCH